MDEICLENTRRFSYASMQTATNNFSKKRLIGQGGSGRVYRGVLPNKTLIAVKKYKQTEEQRLQCDLPPAAVDLMQCIRHQNINQLLGYCMENDQQLLVSEYVDNGTLLDLLQDLKKRESVFSWDLRVAVSIGIARGLSFLHENVNPHVIHRDLMPGHILLDKNFTPKIFHFDIAMMFCDNSLSGTSGHANEFIHTLPINTCVMGSGGGYYTAPEHIRTGELTEKSDVYSFGVVMLEVISGRLRPFFNRHNQWQSIPQWASALKEKGRVLKIVDPVLSDFSPNDMSHLIDVAFLCIKVDAKLRPTMREVIQMLYVACYSKRFLRTLDITTTDDTSYTTYLSAASSFRTSIDETNIQDVGESSFESADSNIDLLAQAEAHKFARNTDTCKTESERSSVANRGKFDPANMYRSKSPGVKQRTR